MTTPPYVLLLVENNIIDEERSLAAKLIGETHELVTVESLDDAIEEIHARWPNVIIFNWNNSYIRLSTFQPAINELKLEIPSIVVTPPNQIPTQADPSMMFVEAGKMQLLAQSITQGITKQKSRFIRLSKIVLDCKQHQVLHNGSVYPLTPKEFKLLYLLINRAGQILSRKEIMQHVWETDYMGDTRTLDVHIRWLRKKIEDHPSRPAHLKTVRGEGYIFIINPREFT